MRNDRALWGCLLAGVAAITLLQAVPAAAQDDVTTLKRMIQEEREAARREREAFLSLPQIHPGLSPMYSGTNLDWLPPPIRLRGDALIRSPADRNHRDAVQISVSA
jgi:hypothetical protein